PSVSVTVMMLAPSTSPLTRALQVPPVITGAVSVAAVLVVIVRVSAALVNVPVMVWLEILVGVATLMFRKIGTTVTGPPVTINCACLFPAASTDKGAAVIPLRGELSSPFAEKFATVNAFKAGKLAPAATLNLTVTNSPGCSPAAFATTICSLAGAPAAAGTYLAATRLLLPPAAPELVTAPVAASPLLGSASTVTPAGRLTHRSMPAMRSVVVPTAPSLSRPPVNFAAVARGCVTAASLPPPLQPPSSNEEIRAAASRHVVD